MTLNIESTSIGKLVKSQPEFYENLLRPKFENAKKIVTAERETVKTVHGWALKDIIGGHFKRKKRRYFVYEEGGEMVITNVLHRHEKGFIKSSFVL